MKNVLLLLLTIIIVTSCASTAAQVPATKVTKGPTAYTFNYVSLADYNEVLEKYVETDSGQLTTKVILIENNIVIEQGGETYMTIYNISRNSDSREDPSTYKGITSDGTVIGIAISAKTKSFTVYGKAGLIVLYN